MAPEGIVTDSEACLQTSFRRQITTQCCALDNVDRNIDRSFNDFPDDIQDLILAKLPYEHLFQVKVVSKLLKARIESDRFNSYRGRLHHREARLSAFHFSVRRDAVWRCAGYDLDTKAWKKLPPLAMLPRLDTNLFKDHSICGAGGLFCVCISALHSTMAWQEKIVILNPLTGSWRELPPLNYRRNPVLVHMVVAPKGDSFTIIVAGSARTGNEHLSKITEVFDSRTSVWTITEDLPGPAFAVNEHQTGAYLKGILYCTAFLDGDRGRGLLAYSVDEGKWLSHLACPLPAPRKLNSAQVANINGEVVVFSEIEHNPYNPSRAVEYRIDILNSGQDTTESEIGNWRNLMTETSAGNHAGLQIYPEFTCVPFGDGKLCIFNTICHTGAIYDMKSGNRSGVLKAPTWNGRGELSYYSLNPPTFILEPSFAVSLELKLTHGSD